MLPFPSPFQPVVSVRFIGLHDHTCCPVNVSRTVIQQAHLSSLVPFGTANEKRQSISFWISKVNSGSINDFDLEKQRKREEVGEEGEGGNKADIKGRVS